MLHVIKHVEPHIETVLVMRHDMAGCLPVHIVRSRLTDDQLAIEVLKMLEPVLHELVRDRLVAA